MCLLVTLIRSKIESCICFLMFDELSPVKHMFMIYTQSCKFQCLIVWSRTKKSQITFPRHAKKIFIPHNVSKTISKILQNLRYFNECVDISETKGRVVVIIIIIIYLFIYNICFLSYGWRFSWGNREKRWRHQTRHSDFTEPHPHPPREWMNGDGNRVHHNRTYHHASVAGIYTTTSIGRCRCGHLARDSPSPHTLPPLVKKIPGLAVAPINRHHFSPPIGNRWPIQRVEAVTRPPHQPAMLRRGKEGGRNGTPMILERERMKGGWAGQDPWWVSPGAGKWANGVVVHEGLREMRTPALVSCRPAGSVLYSFHPTSGLALCR